LLEHDRKQAYLKAEVFPSIALDLELVLFAIISISQETTQSQKNSTDRSTDE